ncbi:MAG: serine/threonine-protein kinase [Candidatus Eisenbacteria bacterium]
MTGRSRLLAVAISAAVLLVAISQHAHFERAFRSSRLFPVPVHRGKSLALCYGDFDGDGSDEEVQLFTDGRGAVATSRPSREVRWEFSGTRRFDGIGFLPGRANLPPRVWLRSESPDSLFLLFLDAISGAPADTICLLSSQFGPGDPFHPKNGAFDGAALPFGYVDLPDGGIALALEFRCGRNLMPRGFGAWDLQRKRFAWRVPLGPTPTRSDHPLRRTPSHPEGLWVFGTVAPCNGAIGSGIPDTEFGVAAVSPNGEIIWWRKFGEGFGATQADVARTADAESLTVVASIFSQGAGRPGKRLVRLDIDTGRTLDSLELQAGPIGVLAADVTRDGIDEVIVTTDDGAIEVRRVGAGMPVIARAVFAPGTETLLANDLNHDARPELVVADTSGVTILDARLEALAHTRLPEGMAHAPAPRLVRLGTRTLAIAFPEKAGPIYRFESKMVVTPEALTLVIWTVFAGWAPWGLIAYREWAWERAKRARRPTDPIPSLPMLLSHFQVTEKLGEGGRGVVYYATDTWSGRTVALKFIRPDLERSDRLLQRFVREAQILARLSHPNIPTVYEFSSAGGHDYIAMEYIGGRTLDDRLRDGALPIPEAVRRARDLASALAAANEQGVLHRDMKPGNVMITSKGETKLMDFGLGRLTLRGGSGTGGAPSLTTGVFREGTAMYASPELVRGEEIDHRTDIYGLGTILFEMTTGVNPYPAKSLEAYAYAIVHRPPPGPTLINSAIPLQLEEVILACLQKDPNDRYQSAKDVLKALEDVTL